MERAPLTSKWARRAMGTSKRPEDVEHLIQFSHTLMKLSKIKPSLVKRFAQAGLST
jgi:hypothetical protein